MKTAVIVFPGSNCDRDVQVALRQSMGSEPLMVWHGDASLPDVDLIVVPGGFSYGDVLGAGEGWAKTILFNSRARDEFEAFFHRDETFSLGICNGCQMMSNLRDLIPGTEQWPRFVRQRTLEGGFFLNIHEGAQNDHLPSQVKK